MIGFISKIGSIGLFYYLPSYFYSRSDLKILNRDVNYLLAQNIGALIGNVVLGFLSDYGYSRRAPPIFMAILTASIINILITIL